MSRRLARLWRVVFAAGAAASLGVCVGTIVVWASAMPGQWHVNYNTSDGRYRVEPGWVGLTVLGPPAAGGPVAGEIAARMSGNDFAWGRPARRAEGWCVRGDVVPGTATWEMYQRFERQLPAETMLDPGRPLFQNSQRVPPAALEPVVGVWLRALDDLCASCGYDLRASPERCPECGTPMKASGTSRPAEVPA